ncbi:MAG: hypothetical protein KGI28_09015 [Thaumarchaeota archaeon]|nr:hypothetical protein [Nitrososphaerota archaeon]
MRLFGKKFECDQYKIMFSKDEKFVEHACHIHHPVMVKYSDCGKEFVYEEDRLHHARKKHEKKMERRSQKS